MNSQTDMINSINLVDQVLADEFNLKVAFPVNKFLPLPYGGFETVLFHEKDDIQSVTTDLGAKDTASPRTRYSLNTRSNSEHTTVSKQEQSEDSGCISGGVKGLTISMAKNPPQKDYFIPGLYRHRSSHYESMEDNYLDSLTKSPTQLNLPKDTKVFTIPAENPCTISTVGLPARSSEIDEGTTPGFSSLVQYRFPHIIENKDDATNTLALPRLSTPRPAQNSEAPDQIACGLSMVEEKPEFRFPSFDSSSDSWGSDSEAQDDDSEGSNHESDDDQEEVKFTTLGKRKLLRPTTRRNQKAIKL